VSTTFNLLVPQRRVEVENAKASSNEALDLGLNQHHL